MKADPNTVLRYHWEYLLFVVPYNQVQGHGGVLISVAALGSCEMVMCFMFHFTLLNKIHINVPSTTEAPCMKGFFMHIKLLHLRHRWLILDNRQHSFKLTEVMGNCPKFPSIVGKWGKYSHVHLCCTSQRQSNFWKEPWDLDRKEKPDISCKQSFPSASSAAALAV